MVLEITAAPPVSIGVPVYNGASLLDECLANLVSQDFTDVEIVISDNASTDHTPDICSDWARRDPRVRHVRHREQIPVLQNFCMAHSETSGTLFMWRAHDDLSSENYISTLVDVMRANVGTRLAVSRVQRERDDCVSPPRDYPYKANDSGKKFCRLLSQLANGKASWFYGLWDRNASSDAIRLLLDDYRDAWAGDHLVVLCQAVQDGIRGSNDAVFRQRLLTKAGTRSFDNLRFTAHEMRVRNTRFANLASEAIAASSNLGSLERVFLRALLPIYVADRVHSPTQIREAAKRANHL